MESELDVDPISARPIYREDPLRYRRESTRLVIVGGLMLMLAVVVFAAVYASFDNVRWANMDKLLCAVLAPLSGLVGAAVGFYFRTERD